MVGLEMFKMGFVPRLIHNSLSYICESLRRLRMFRRHV
jgi:hypothetical protein